MEKWMIKNIKYNYEQLAKACSIDPIVARLLVNRGVHTVEDIKKFLNTDINNFNDTSKMKDLDKGVLKIDKSIKDNKKILIVGDYDVDGVISSFILYKAFKRLNANVSYHIPDRIKEGYGINDSIIKKAYDENIDIIITCDNGIAAIEQVNLANELKIEVIITDHHDVQETVPNAFAVINPKQEDCSYNFKRLCGAAIAYKFVERLYEINNISKDEVIELMQYAAIATVCDVVDLVDENRIIVKKGLEILNKTNNIGLRALFEETGLKDKEITVYSIGFVIGPSINAAGRLEQAFWALELLLTEDVDKAKFLAQKLNDLNKERQDLTKDGVDKAISIIEENNMNKDKVLVVYLDDIHESIAGIIAGRVKEKYNLPTIILTKAHDGAKGSGRSIEEYNMFEELLKCKDLLKKFGGHPMAAGMSLEISDIDRFRERLNKMSTLTDEDVLVKVPIDISIPLSDINYKLLDNITLLQPYGKANPKPSFAIRNLKVLGAKILGKNANVLKLNLTDGNIKVEGIYFGDIEKFEETIIKEYGEAEYTALFSNSRNNIFLDLIYFPEVNEFRGNKSVQLVISNYRVSK